MADTDMLHRHFVLHTYGPFKIKLATSKLEGVMGFINLFHLRSIETPKFVHSAQKVFQAFEKNEKLEHLHDLSNIEVNDSYMVKNGHFAVQYYYFLTVGLFLYMDSLLRKLPNSGSYDVYLRKIQNNFEKKLKGITVKESREQLQQMINAVKRARNSVRHHRDELIGETMELLKKDYGYLLNMIKSVEREDAATLMSKYISTIKDESASLGKYLMIRWGVKDVIRDYGKVVRLRRKIVEDIVELRRLADEQYMDKKKPKFLEPQHITDFIDKLNKKSDEIFKMVETAFKEGMGAVLRSGFIMFGMIRILNEMYRDQEKLAEEHQIPRDLAKEMELRIKEILIAIRDAAKYEALQAVGSVAQDAKKDAA
ncbi:hypothetical protein J4227_01335 [Candidatus Woesearchaeota archaeon]|nr:hypothetical protein [Candidatus Woesearchaeota archaeon]